MFHKQHGKELIMTLYYTKYHSKDSIFRLFPPDEFEGKILDFRFSRDRSGDFNNGADSADDVQRQVWHKIEQQDTDFKQRHAGVMDGIKSILG
jgi:hypothetical protein